MAAGAGGLRAQDGPPPSTPLRQTFVSAGQVVIDDALAIDVKADNDHFAGAMQQLKEATDNLAAMADEDREKEIAGEMKDMMFQISSCHIQAIDGTPTDKCEAQVKTAERRAMELLKRHKEGGTWVEGAPQ
jgi:hypothetical protein